MLSWRKDPSMPNRSCDVLGRPGRWASTLFIFWRSRRKSRWAVTLAFHISGRWKGINSRIASGRLAMEVMQVTRELGQRHPVTAVFLGQNVSGYFLEEGFPILAVDFHLEMNRNGFRIQDSGLASR